MQLISGRLDDVLKAKLSASFIGAGQGETDLVEADSSELSVVDPGGAQGDPQLRGGVDPVVEIGQGHAGISRELSGPGIRAEWIRTSSCPRAEGGDEHGGAAG